MPWHEPDHRDRQPRGGSLAAALRREAIAERPAFSREFHDQLMRRVTKPARPRPNPTVAAKPLSARWPAAGLVATLAAVVAVVAVSVMTPSSDDVSRVRQGEPRPPLAATTTASAPDGGAIAGDEAPGIDRLPTFTEIEESVSDGVASLAASLFEVPDWTALADFDASAGLDAADIP